MLLQGRPPGAPAARYNWGRALGPSPAVGFQRLTQPHQLGGVDLGGQRHRRIGVGAGGHALGDHTPRGGSRLAPRGPAYLGQRARRRSGCGCRKRPGAASSSPGARQLHVLTLEALARIAPGQQLQVQAQWPRPGGAPAARCAGRSAGGQAEPEPGAAPGRGCQGQLTHIALLICAAQPAALAPAANRRPAHAARRRAAGAGGQAAQPLRPARRPARAGEPDDGRAPGPGRGGCSGS